ncbi:hypothetical protein [Virgibacillus sp. YIM 98842]|uniref:hypothetical protein n=1 Tax=Virgibacillus sp. YIM 98842 TaxID=2663533 RepID=UPI0013DAD934|nr:hypothetical protein [Virgibacillus sp. YIM 98842]
MRDLNSVCYFWLVRDVIHDWKVRYKMNERELKATGLPFKKVRSYTDESTFIHGGRTREKGHVPG